MSNTTQVAVQTFSPAPGLSYNIRIVTIDGAPWFVAADICQACGRSGVTHALAFLNTNEKGLCKVQTLGGQQQLGIVSESGLYKLMLRSSKLQARAFQDWVTGVVLPSIRTTGSYVMNEEKLSDPSLSVDELEALNDTLIALQAKKAALLEARLEAAIAANALLETEVATMAPKAVLVDEHFAHTGTVQSDFKFR